MAEFLRKHFFFVLLFLLPAAVAASLVFGSVVIPPSGFFEPSGALSPLFYSRLLQCAAAFAVGGSLALAGAVYQAVLRNVLAEPFILGVSGGAAVGAAFAFICGFAALTVYAVPLFATAGGIAALGLVLALGVKRRGGGNAGSLLLSGVIVGTICSSVLMCIVSFAGTHELCSITWWMLGDLSSSDPALLGALWISAPLLALFLFSQAPKANALSLGAEYAWSMGIAPVRTGAVLVCAASLLAAQTVGVAGIISFVGLIIPHIVRRLYRSDNRVLFPASFLAGGIYLIFCDIVSRSIHPAREIQIGVVTALVGGPVFLWLLNRGPGAGAGAEAIR